MYELTDSKFFIFEPFLLTMVGVVIVLAIAGILFFIDKKRSNRN